MAIYSSNWMDISSVEVRSKMLVLMRRSQKPFVINVHGIIREVSLAQYADVRFEHKISWSMKSKKFNTPFCFSVSVHFVFILYEIKSDC